MSRLGYNAGTQTFSKRDRENSAALEIDFPSFILRLSFFIEERRGFGNDK
jgi:hypothetical protein